jgi:hypothetical protein
MKSSRNSRFQVVSLSLPKIAIKFLLEIRNINSQATEKQNEKSYRKYHEIEWRQSFCLIPLVKRELGINLSIYYILKAQYGSFVFETPY